MIETIKITSREQWLSARKQDVTASAAAALLGEHPYLTPFELWALKMGKIDDPEDTPAMKRGRLLEPVAIELMKERHPDWEFQLPGVYLRDPARRLGATPDLYARRPDGSMVNCQIKTADHWAFKANWFDKNTQSVDLPTWISFQTMIETELSLAEAGMVALMTIGNGLNLYEIDVPRHAGAMRALSEAVADFWALMDSGKPMPPDYGRDGEAIKRVYDAGGAPAIDLTGDNGFGAALAAREQYKAIEKDAKEKVDLAETEIKAKMGNSDVAKYGGKSVTWKLQHRGEYIAKATSFRVLRVGK